MPLTDASFPRFSSVKTLLNGLFDYAGLFPPATLPMREALLEYLAHRAEPDDWMLGPFVLPVSRLNELGEFCDLLSDESPLSLDLLPASGSSVDSFCSTLGDELKASLEFAKEMEGRVMLDSFEYRVPPDALASPASVVPALSRIESIFRSAGVSHLPRYAEITRTDQFMSELPHYLLALGAQQSQGLLRAKIRCGGMNEKDFPSVTELASFLQAVIRTGQPFKATAGLHHPVRHFNESQGVTMHGFLNVFFAVTLGRMHALDVQQLVQILSDTDPGSFIFTDGGIEWKDLRATTTAFIQDRRTLALSIGSCSFDEPRQDLRDLRWLTH